jgi:hypothetical protein
MKVTGLTIIRNAIINDYPVVESIQSILPLVDEMIVSIDKADDDTEQLIKNIGSAKIKIHHTTWDMNLRSGGQVLAVETNKAKQKVSADTTWIVYLQADEVIHEKYHATIKEAMQQYATNAIIEGLCFDYKHFYATYDYIGHSRVWYKREVRIIKNNPLIQSYKDAQGFRKQGKKLKAVLLDAEVYHYGWVKSPQQMKTKLKNSGRFWHNDEAIQDLLNSGDLFDYNDFDSLKKFDGTHPAIMQQRIAAKNWNIQLDIKKKNLKWKDRFLLFIEKLTGRRLFDFRNYRLIRFL